MIVTLMARSGNPLHPTVDLHTVRQFCREPLENRPIRRYF